MFYMEPFFFYLIVKIKKAKKSCQIIVFVWLFIHLYSNQKMIDEENVPSIRNDRVYISVDECTKIHLI